MLLLKLGIGNGSCALAPVPKGNVTPQHSAKVRKMGDALLSAENSAEQFKQAVQDHEYYGRHRNWRKDQDNRAGREEHAEGQQNAKDRS